ncbi:2-hydroxyglutarate dehydrogenase [Candidatus Brocadiaceae bacterium]|nr:2-hydroxyglutarate dehydrogenase [Candidatus Brocadiaceae bacterium]
MPDVLIVGGGIIGTATAMHLSARSISVMLIEAEPRLAQHQTGHNSGVIHSGIYYKPGSLKAKNCRDGRIQLINFCERRGIPYELCGKIIAAVNEEENSRLQALYQRGLDNGLSGIRFLDSVELQEREPYVSAVNALLVPETGIVNYRRVTEEMAAACVEKGGEIATNTKFISANRLSNGVLVETSSGKIRTKLLINCAGLYSDLVARKSGFTPSAMIAPFRGEYYHLAPSAFDLINHLVYPVPDPKFPFLGVHFTRTIDGMKEAGPNAVLAFARKGYSYTDFSLRDMLELASYPGIYHLARKHMGVAVKEYYRSLNKNEFIKALQKLVPTIQESDLVKGGSGVRAQALLRDGRLADDFIIQESENMIHVLNAPSPAATASMSIGNHLTQMVGEKLKK